MKYLKIFLLVVVATFTFGSAMAQTHRTVHRRHWTHRHWAHHHRMVHHN